MKTVFLKNAFIMAIVASGLISCAQYSTNAISGNGTISTINRTTSTYEGVKCSGSMDFNLIKGTEGNITLKGESNLLPYIITEVQNNILIIKVKDGVNLKTSKSEDILITIPFEDINEVSLTGSGDVINNDVISSNYLKVNVTGSGDIVLDINATTTETSITGSGDIALKGDTENLEATVTGSGDFHGYNLNAKHTNVSVTGSGDAEVVSLNSLKGRVSGSGDIGYKGNPEKEDTKVSGSGSISSY